MCKYQVVVDSTQGMIPFKVPPCDQIAYKEQRLLRHEGMKSFSSWCCPFVDLGKLHLGLCFLRGKSRRGSPGLLLRHWAPRWQRLGIASRPVLERRGLGKQGLPGPASVNRNHSWKP